MTEQFKLQQTSTHRGVFSIDLSASDSSAAAAAEGKPGGSDTAPKFRLPSTSGFPSSSDSAGKYCLPSGQARAASPAAGLFQKQGVQAVCCTFHANAQKKPKEAAVFAKWTLASITPVSRHSAVYHFTSTDKTRGTPFKRGRGRTMWYKTWHTTLRTADEVERGDYTPTSTWEQWEAGECDLLVGGEARASSGLRDTPLGTDVWLSKPKTTLSVPSLVHPYQLVTYKDEAIAHAGVLLVLGGPGGIVTAAQVLQHADATTCFDNGFGGARVPPLQSPVHLIYACERDDALLTDELARWCTTEDATRARLRRLVLALSAPRGDDDGGAAAASPHEEKEGDAHGGLEQLQTLENVRVVQADASPSSLTGELLQAEIAPLHALGRCRVVVSGPAAFNVAVANMLEAQCGVAPDAITIVDASGDPPPAASDDAKALDGESGTPDTESTSASMSDAAPDAAKE